MNDRQKDLLRILLTAQSFFFTKDLADTFNVSTRTIRRDLNFIQTELEERGLKLLRKPNNGIYISGSQKKKDQLLSFYGSSLNIYDVRIRRLLLALLIFNNDINFSSQDASDYFFVSLQTIDADIDFLNFEYKISPDIKTSRSGISWNGDEISRRNYLMIFLSELFSFNIDLGVIPVAFIDKQTNKVFINHILDSEDILLLHHVLNFIYQKSNIILYKQDQTIVKVSTLISMFSIKSKCLVKSDMSNSFYEKHDSLEEVNFLYQLCYWIHKMIADHYSQPIDYDEIDFLKKTFSSTQLHLLEQQNQKGDIAEGSLSYAFAEDFIDAFSTITDIELRADKNYYQRILNHIILMIDRIKLKVEVSIGNLETFAEQYPRTMNIVKVISWILCQKYDLPSISMSEQIYLMLYIQSQIIDKQSKQKIYLVSDYDRSVTQVMMSTIRFAFPHSEIVHVSKLAKSDYESNEEQLVLTTDVDLLDEDIPYLFMTPLITQNDLIKIYNVTSEDIFQKEQILTKINDTLRDLMDLGCLVESNVLSDCKSSLYERYLLVTSVQNIKFTYSLNQLKNNKIQFFITKERNIVEICLELSDWDYMLYASKLLFLIDKIACSMVFIKNNKLAYKI